MSYYRNNYGYLMNYQGESHKISNTNQISSPRNPNLNLNINYSNNKPTSNYRNKKKLSEITKLNFASENNNNNNNII